MDTITQVFVWWCICLGVLGTFCGLAWGTAWIVNKTFIVCRLWSTLALLVAQARHGRKYQESLLFDAVDEFAYRGYWSAKSIADHAKAALDNVIDADREKGIDHTQPAGDEPL